MQYVSRCGIVLGWFWGDLYAYSCCLNCLIYLYLRHRPFLFASASVALSIICLGLTLASSIQNGYEGNPLGIPGGVTSLVQAAQFFGAIVGKI